MGVTATKIVYHENFTRVYCSDPAAAPGRLEPARDALKALYEFVEPLPAADGDIVLVHSDRHVSSVKSTPIIYEMAKLAAGGAIRAAELALSGEPAFALVRPPGHHARRDYAWGFCFFNNIAISLEKLFALGLIKKALIVDFDLHYGDGTASIFSGSLRVEYFHLPREESLRLLKGFLQARDGFDILAVSAGFDRHVNDWGGMLRNEDYEEIGAILKRWSEKACGGRRYAALEGGYNPVSLAEGVKAFLNGFR